MDFSQLGNWARETLGSGAVAAALLGGAGWLFRQQISAWLNKDLEALKAQYQRELEAYKVSLIAEAERAKANAEVNKAGALLIVEKRFTALDRLHTSTLRNASELLYAASRPPAEKAAEQHLKMMKRVRKLRNEFANAEIFLSFDQRKLVQTYLGELGPLCGRCAVGTPALEGAEMDATQASLHEAEIDVDRMLRDQINGMMKIGD